MSDTSARHPDVHLQNLSKGELADGSARRLLGVRGPSSEIKSFAADFRSHDQVTQFERIPGADAGLVFYTSEIEYRPENPSILEMAYTHGCYQHNSVHIRDGTEIWKLFTDNRSAVHSLTSEIEDHGNDVSLHQSTDIGELDDTDSLQFGSLAMQLTSRQKTIFETALELDYYDIESETTTETIAEELDLHQSTVWEHLSKAENVILTEVGTRLFSLEE